MVVRSRSRPAAHCRSARLKQSSPADRPVLDSAAVLAGCGTRRAERQCASALFGCCERFGGGEASLDDRWCDGPALFVTSERSLPRTFESSKEATREVS